MPKACAPAVAPSAEQAESFVHSEERPRRIARRGLLRRRKGIGEHKPSQAILIFLIRIATTVDQMNWEKNSRSDRLAQLFKILLAVTEARSA